MTAEEKDPETRLLGAALGLLDGVTDSTLGRLRSHKITTHSVRLPATNLYALLDAIEEVRPGLLDHYEEIRRGS